MAPDLRKRKADASAAPSAKKSKKSTKKATSSATVGPSPLKPQLKKAAPTPRKKAADFYEEDESDEQDDGWDKTNKDKTGKKTTVRSAVQEKMSAKKTTKNHETGSEPKPKAKDDAEEADISLNGEDLDEGTSSGDEEEDGYTAALLAGFEDSDEEEVEQGSRKKVVRSSGGNVERRVGELEGKSTPGIVYLGRVPHGFYEHEMRAYFSQFGQVTRLRLSRNKKTGRSKHYAFIEFADSEVAEIVAETMDSYLLFGHILRCKVVPRDNFEYVEQLFKGANKRFKARPTAKLAKAEHDKKRPAEMWEKKVKRENKRRRSVTDRIKKRGIDYEFKAPVVQKIQVAVKEAEPEPVVESPALPEIKVVEKVIETEVATPQEKPVTEEVVGAVVAKKKSAAVVSSKKARSKAKKPTKAKA